MKNAFFLITMLFLMISCTQKSPLEQVLTSNTGIIQKVMKSPEKYELQVMYTQINRNKTGEVSFKNFKFNVDDSIYFYPASSVKLPIALIALEKLKELQGKGIKINRKTSFTTKNDTLYTTIEKEITKIFAVSDNQAYNRLFEFLGQDYINEQLHFKNMTGRISHRLSAFYSLNPKTQSIFFKENIEDTSFIYHQESIENSLQPKLSLKKLLKGKAYVYNDTLMPHPKDFSEKNYLPLRSLHEITKRIHFPDKYSKSQKFDITTSDYQFVLNAMNTLPYEAGYDRKKYYDSYGKFFLFGDTKDHIPEHIDIYNKVGYAYGYLTDCAYIKDTKNNIEFVLSATIHVNKNGIYNDDNYEYKEIGIPFLAELGRQIYELEKERKK
ncbi:serine hydrolase [Aquimarina sp. AU474]|uniref:serine hydrolase n=1 Tax=Aquimarina sp. AU474 TaxID=2108529 RepID=UPI000D6990AD|nr:serine hydrolase [Aquimarina sp. AU474]